MSERIRREFTDFLADADSYDDFAYQLHIQRGITFSRYMRLAESEPRKLIEMAFNWSGKGMNDTDMANYWSILDNKWREYLDS